MIMFATRASAENVAAHPKMLAAGDLQTDFAVFKSAYESLHPGLYLYNSREQMGGEFAALQQALNHDQPLASVFLALSEFTAKIKCGHSYPNFFNQADSVADALFKQQDKLPFYFRWLDGRMILTRDFSGNPDLRPGTEVVAINGAPVKAILERLLTVARADGSNKAKRIAQLEVSGTDRYEAFDIYFPMFFPQSSPEMTLRIVPYPTVGVGEKTVVVRALTYAQRVAPISANRSSLEGGDTEYWDSRFLADGTAVLRMPTWETYKSKWDWKSYLEAFFDDIEKKSTPHLIIDIRGNEGGTDVGDVILRHLIKGNLNLPATVRLVRYRRVPPDLVQYLKTWDPSFKDWGERAVELGNGFYSLKSSEAASDHVLTPSGLPFAGDVYVLVDASNSSATFLFSLVIQRQKLGLLVGQPTGGNKRGINGGAFFFLYLPRSGIEVDVPLIGQYPVAKQPDEGLTPDILVHPSIRDIATGADSDLNALAAERGIGRHQN
jgi:Peptidase family S41